MATNYIADGATVDWVATAAVESGDLVVIGNIVGVALDDIANGATGVVLISGVVKVPKQASLVVAQGDLLYCNETGGELDKTAASQTLAGTAYAAELAASTTVKVLLNVGAERDTTG